MLQLVGLLDFDSFVAISGHIWIRRDLHLASSWASHISFWIVWILPIRLYKIFGFPLFEFWSAATTFPQSSDFLLLLFFYIFISVIHSFTSCFLLLCSASLEAWLYLYLLPMQASVRHLTRILLYIGVSIRRLKFPWPVLMLLRSEFLWPRDWISCTTKIIVLLC